MYVVVMLAVIHLIGEDAMRHTSKGYSCIMHPTMRCNNVRCSIYTIELPSYTKKCVFPFLYDDKKVLTMW